MFMLSLFAAATNPAAKTKLSPVIKGINAPTNNPVPAKTNPNTAP